jgi:hypothetical protein
MTEEEYTDETEIRAEITPDFVLEVYERAQDAEGEEQKIMLKIAEVLADHIGDYIDLAD